MAKNSSITLGDTTFQIGMLTVGQLRAIDGEIADDLPEGKRAREEFLFDQAVKIIALGISTPQKTYTPAEVSALPANSVSEIYDARTAILIHAGLLISKEKKPGEVRAEAS